MNVYGEDRPAPRGRRPDRGMPRGKMAIAGLALVGIGLVTALYNACKIEVGTGHQAVLIRREGLELEPDMELAPPPQGWPDLLQGRPGGRAQ